ncbi:MAG: GNAT family N-acetyltransferase [Thermoproteota archaeon]
MSSPSRGSRGWKQPSQELRESQARVPIERTVYAKVKSVEVPRTGYRWRGDVVVQIEGGVELHLVMAGTIAQWLREGEELRLLLREEPLIIGDKLVAMPEGYEAWRIVSENSDSEEVKIWPPWRFEATLERTSPLSASTVYRYRVVAREAITEEDYMEIVQLEQHHYASREERVAIWRCPICGRYEEANLQPRCPVHGIPMRLQEIRGSLPSSRFLVLELVDGKPYEPKIAAYVRVDTPIPLMSRRLPDGKVEKLIRERVFDKSWFHPTFWPLAYSRRRELAARYRELANLYGSKRLARAIMGEEVSAEALRNANTAAARIARVVVHPDYRGDGLGVLAVRMALRWIAERRIPEMKRRKHIVETIAQMARYNPFFEKAGFRYVWDTASNRPVLVYPLTAEAKEKLDKFLSRDPYARQHRGRLYKQRFAIGEPLSGPIELKGVTKIYTSVLDIKRLPADLQDVLRAFGVERRSVERYVLRNVNVRIEPGEVVAVVGLSGAGKTTFLRMIIGAAARIDNEMYRPSEGEIVVPDNARIEYMLPGEHEPQFGDETLLEHVARKLEDPIAAVEVLNIVGLSDAVFYRARFSELSTGQKERAKLASMLAGRPNLMVIDEFAAHLDSLTAMRVARKLSQIARMFRLTLIVATNRADVLSALVPTKTVYVASPTVYVEELAH